MSTYLLVSQLVPPGEVIAQFKGTAALTVGSTAMTQSVATVAFGADGTTTVSATPYSPSESRLTIVAQTDQSLTVSLVGGTPNTPVDFTIDGVAAGSITTDSNGNIVAASLLVPATLPAGTHTLAASQAGDVLPSQASYVWTPAPNAPDVVRGADQPPVEVPAAITSWGRRWVFQDLMPGGLGSYVLEQNPASWVAPNFIRSLVARHTTAQAGKFHVYEPGRAPFEWSFKGICPTQAMHDKLRAYGDLNRRFYVIDHRGRAWIATFVKVELVARKRTNYGGVATDWVHDYTVTALVYDENPRTPA